MEFQCFQYGAEFDTIYNNIKNQTYFHFKRPRISVNFHQTHKHSFKNVLKLVWPSKSDISLTSARAEADRDEMRTEIQIAALVLWYLVRVCQQQDLCDGSWRQDGVEGWELSARWRLQLHLHHLMPCKCVHTHPKTSVIPASQQTHNDFQLIKWFLQIA